MLSLAMILNAPLSSFIESIITTIWLYVRINEKNCLEVLNKIFFGKKKVLCIVPHLKEMNELWVSLPLPSCRDSEDNATLWGTMPYLGDPRRALQQSPGIKYRGLSMYFYSIRRGREQVSPQIKGETQHEEAKSACAVQIRNHLTLLFTDCPGMC